MVPFRVFLLSTFFLCCTVTAQGQLKRGIGLSFEGRAKKDIQRKLDNNPESLESYTNYNTKGWGVSLDIQLKKKMFLEIGYSRESYYTSWNIPNQFVGYELFMIGNMVPIRFKTEWTLVKLKRKKITINPALGYILGFNSTYDALVGSNIFSYSTSNGDWVFTKYLRNKQEYNLSKRYSMIDLRTLIKLPISKTFSIQIGGGYTQGLRPLSYTKIDYVYKGQPAIPVLNRNRGTNYYITAGVRFDIVSLLADN
jgi:hypothetical protein